MGFVWLTALAVGLRADVVVTGRVTNDVNAPVAGARVVLRSDGGAPIETVSDQSGAFTCRISETGDYLLSAERTGYFRLENLGVSIGAARELHVVLTPVREVYETIDVSASPQTVALDTVTQSRTVSGAEILAIPFPASNDLKNALRIMPGVVQDAKAGIHINGAAEEQIAYTLNGFTLNDPLTGRLESRVGVESVQTVEMMDGRLPAGIGRGAAGAVAITTTPGDDKFRYTATNFAPGVESSKGVFVGSWNPRFGFSGPIRKGRAWISETASIQYSKEVLRDLPDGADRLSQWRFNNVLHSQVNLTRSQILRAGVLFNGWWAPHTGLNNLTPLEATVDKSSRQWFLHASHQTYLRRGALVEVGYAANRAYGREVPQGTAPLIVTPDGYAGNASTDATRRGGRDQWLASIVGPEWAARGVHQLRAGVDVSRVGFAQDVRRSGFEYYRQNRLASRVGFGGPTHLEESNLQLSFYAQDAWRPTRDLLVEVGVRSDRDTLIGAWSLSPRLGAGWSPGGGRTVLRAGYSVVYEETNLRLFTRPLDQFALTTYYSPDGAVTRSAALVFTRGGSGLSVPRAHNWSAALQRALGRNADLQLRYIGRRGARGFTFVNTIAGSEPPPRDLDALYALDNLRRDAYDAVEFTGRQTLRGQYGWMASYTRSRAVSNAALDIEIADPIRLLNNAGPMPWDSPHRIVGWAYAPLPWRNWALAGMVEARTGFPYSIQNEAFTVAELNTRRFPFFFEWNQHIERRFVLRGHRWEFRGGFNNITNHYNPNVVNANAESVNFLRYYGGQRRAANFRIRWLGRAESRSHK